MEMVVIITFANVAFTDPFRYTRLVTAVEKLSRNTTFVSLVSTIVVVAGGADQ